LSFEDISFGREGLAAYACQWRQSRGRLFTEDASPTRSPFQRDRDRIIHSTAFRRLKYKTQVFVFHEGDHYRTRLTHSIEVAQIARALARALRVDEDLAEALALSHDFGHTPFGHTGEEALDDLMADHGGFDHNAQSLRIVTKLERRYAEFDGLNLSWETLEGLVKHNGPLVGSDGKGLDGSVPVPILEFNDIYDLDLGRHSGLEAQCAAIADDIAYNAHDLDDGLRAGLFDLDALDELPIIRDISHQVRRKYPGLDPQRTTNEIVRRQITQMVEDVLVRSFGEVEALDPQSDEDVRNAGRTLIAFGEEMSEADKAIKTFLFNHVYRAPTVMKIRANAKQIVRELFDAYFSGRAQMPHEWGSDWRDAGGSLAEQKRARLVADFLAGMTDRYALVEHRRLFDVTPDLR
jgi:dGTPase